MTTTPAPPRGMGTEQRTRFVKLFIDFLVAQDLLDQNEQASLTESVLGSCAQSESAVLEVLGKLDAFEAGFSREKIVQKWKTTMEDAEVTMWRQGNSFAGSDSDTQPVDEQFLRSLAGDIPQEIGAYHIMRVLGEGGFGKVYLGEHKKLGRFDAVKVVGNIDDPDTRERTVREATVGANIDHPNLVRVHDINLEHDPPYIAMEFIKGKPFDKCVEDFPAGDIPSIVRLVIGVARGAGALHQRGLVHRDIKPANVLVDETGRPVVVDGGLIKHEHGHDVREASSRHEIPVYTEEELTKTPKPSPKEESSSVTRVGEAVGTPMFMAPEQTTNEGVGPPADIYSIGKMLYQVVTGSHLHKVGDQESILKLMGMVASQSDIPEELETVFRPSVPDRYAPDRLVQILSRCLAKYPENRFQSGGELANELEGYLTEIEKSEEEKLQEQELALRRSRRRTRVLVSVMVGLTLTVGAVYLYTSRLLKAEQTARLAEAGERAALAKAVEEKQKAAKQAEVRALEKEEARAREEKARLKVEGLLTEVQAQHRITSGLNTARTAMREARWKDARREFDTILELAPQSMDIREPRAQVLFNLRSPSSINEYIWLAKQKRPKHMDEHCWSHRTWEFQLTAMLAVLEFSSKSLEKKLKELRQLAQVFTEEGIYKDIGWILVQSTEIRYLRSKKKPIQNRAGALKSKVLDLFESDHDSAVANYVIALQLEPHFNNRNRTLDLLGSAYAKNPDFFPSLIARQRNSRWVVDELGFDHVRAPTLIKSAQDDLVLLRERLPGRVEIDMAYVQCLVYKSRIRSYRHEQYRLVQQAHKVADGYLQKRYTPDYERNARLVELSIALAFAAKYERAKAQNLGDKEQFRAISQVALQKALQLGYPERDVKLQQHNRKKVQLIRTLLR